LSKIEISSQSRRGAEKYRLFSLRFLHFRDDADTDADFTICDRNREWTINSEKIYTKCQLNGYHGRKIKGEVTQTIVGGKVIMDEGEVIGQPGYGKIIMSDKH
jgi:hypothetical protein